MCTISLAAIIFSTLVWTFMRNYVYSMMVTFDLNMRQLLKNAFIFCWVGFFRNILIVLFCAIFFCLIYSISSYNWLLLVFFGVFMYFSFNGFIVNFMVNPLIKKYMIDGYDSETGEKLDEEKYEGFEDFSENTEPNDD